MTDSKKAEVPTPVDHDTIEPLDFKPPSKSIDSEPPASGRIGARHTGTPYLRPQSGSKWWHSQFNLMLAVFGLLACAALMFVLIVPRPAVTASPGDQNAGATEQPAEVSDSEAPYAVSLRAETRTQAQDILQGLLDRQKALEQKGVLDWAPEKFEMALEHARTGDELYKNQSYAEALRSYETAAANMLSIEGMIPELVKQKIEQGNTAVEEGKSGYATSLFEQALALDKRSIAAMQGIDRAQNIIQVLALVAQGTELEYEFDLTDSLAELEQAANLLTEAVSLDGAYKPAQNNLARVSDKLEDKKFRLAMSSAYKALFSHRYTEAQKHFAAALKIKPDNSQARRAQQQSLASNKSASLSVLLSSAASAERDENWASAVDGYAEVLSRDANQVRGKVGLIRARARLALDKELQRVLSNPLNLSLQESRAEAQLLLSDAKSVVGPGARLSDQISSLEATLDGIDSPVKVSLISDQQTSVVLQMRGAKPLNLGRFASKNLSLKPGYYVATGRRLGFQDFRLDINLAVGGQADADAQRFEIVCKQPVGNRGAVEVSAEL